MKILFVGTFRLRCGTEPSIIAVAEKVKEKMPDRVVVETSTATQLSEQRPRRTKNPDSWRTTENSVDTIRHAESLQDANHAGIGNLAMDGLDTLDIVARDTHVERVASHRSEQRMTEITRKRLFCLQRLSCSRSWHQSIVDCHQEGDFTKKTLCGTQGSG